MAKIYIATKEQLDNKQDKLNEAQLNAINSGITADKLDGLATKTEVALKQDKLTAGDGIEISSANVIKVNYDHSTLATKAELADEVSRAETEEAKKLDKVSTVTVKDQMYVKLADGTQAMSDIPDASVIDSAMSDSSTNAVQNKVIKAYVDTKECKVEDVKVDNVSVVTSKIANIDLTPYAKQADLTAEVTRATAKEASLETYCDNLDATKAAQADLTTEVNARTAADTTLTNNLNTEIAARENADNVLDTKIDTKQDKLTAGNNISIAADNTISATDVVTTDTAQTISGNKNFTGNLTKDSNDVLTSSTAYTKSQVDGFLANKEDKLPTYVDSKYLKVNGSALEWSDVPACKVEDVKVDGTSVVTDKVANIDLTGKQDKLPTVVNDKYLHSNATTGALEWSDSVSYTAGDNIDITSNVIKAKDVVTTNTDQTINSNKTFASGKGVILSSSLGNQTATLNGDGVTIMPTGSLVAYNLLYPTSTDGTLAITNDIPSITLNGTISIGNEFSFYAPEDSGNAGQILKSNGGLTAPTWTAVDYYTKTEANTLLNAKQDTITAGTGLSKSGATLNHSNSVTAQTTAKIGAIKFDAQGHITGFTETHLYFHNFVVLSSTATLQCGFVINTSSTAFTISTFAKWLYDNGFTSKATVYAGATGENSNFERYTATTSGGAVTSSTGIVVAMTGWYSEDGTTLKAKSNWAGSYTISNYFTDTVIQIF